MQRERTKRGTLGVFEYWVLEVGQLGCRPYGIGVCEVSLMRQGAAQYWYGSMAVLAAANTVTVKDAAHDIVIIANVLDTDRTPFCRIVAASPLPQELKNGSLVSRNARANRAPRQAVSAVCEYLVCEVGQVGGRKSGMRVLGMRVGQVGRCRYQYASMGVLATTQYFPVQGLMPILAWRPLGSRSSLSGYHSECSCTTTDYA